MPRLLTAEEVAEQSRPRNISAKFARPNQSPCSLAASSRVVRTCGSDSAGATAGVSATGCGCGCGAAVLSTLTAVGAGSVGTGGFAVSTDSTRSAAGSVTGSGAFGRCANHA